ncbi:MAG: LacI family DNA-binding transcriptional regulator [Pseudomonadota bacterium]
MTRKISIKDVAIAAGVSTATVSNVFTGKKPVNKELAERVRTVATELGYRVNKAASLLRSGRSSVVIILVPDLSDPFFTSIVTEVEQLARQEGYEIIVGNSDDDIEVEEGRLNALLAWEPAGAIVIPCSDSLPSRLHDRDLPPTIVVDRVSEFDVVDTVSINNLKAGEKAADLLGKLGHKNILIAASDMALTPIRRRAEGVQVGIERFGGSTRIAELGSDPEHGSAELAHWFDQNEAPTAIFATNDMTTLAVLKFLADRHIEMPEAISVVGFDDYAWMSARRTKITAIRQPIEAIAASVWKQLMSRIGGQEGAVVNAVLECELIIRDSAVEQSKNTEYWGDREMTRGYGLKEKAGGR